MEDEGFVDDAFIEDTAREFVGRDAFASMAVLRERAADRRGGWRLSAGADLAGNRRDGRADAGVTAPAFREPGGARGEFSAARARRQIQP